MTWENYDAELLKYKYLNGIIESYGFFKDSKETKTRKHILQKVIKKLKKPDFIVVGAAKCGTTSLFHYLNQHPNIFIPSVKEGRFFLNCQRILSV